MELTGFVIHKLTGFFGGADPKAEPVNKILDRPHTDKIYAEPNPVNIKYFCL